MLLEVVVSNLWQPYDELSVVSPFALFAAFAPQPLLSAVTFPALARLR
jgi:hypothetical protein